MLEQKRFSSALCGVAIAFGRLTVSACSNSYRPETEVIPGAGQGPGPGATGAVGSGTAGTRGGRAGSRSVPPSPAGSFAPPPGTGGWGAAGASSTAPTFSARLDGTNVIVEVTNSILAYYLTCNDAVVLQKLDAAGTWVRPTDDRPPSYNNPGYYLDGRYVAPSFNEGCNVTSCQNFGSRHFVAKAAEYVQTGLVETTVNGSPVFVPSIETRPLRGVLLIEVRYSYGDPNCNTSAQVVQLKVEVPPFDGVCCPPGREGCNSTGPGGGWALDYDSCRDLLPAYDTYYRRYVDSHGCPFLGEDLSQCCGCYDAGVDG